MTDSSHVRPRRWPAVAVTWLITFSAFTILALAFDAAALALPTRRAGHSVE